MNPLSQLQRYVLIALLGLLAISGLANVVQWSRLEVCQAREETYQAVAGSVNDANQLAIATLAKDNATCVGEKQAALERTAQAEAERAAAQRALSSHRAKRQLEIDEALRNPGCRASGEIPVCPDLIGP